MQNPTKNRKKQLKQYDIGAKATQRERNWRTSETGVKMDAETHRQAREKGYTPSNNPLPLPGDRFCEALVLLCTGRSS